jgi:hypothetical protein
MKILIAAVLFLSAAPAFAEGVGERSDNLQGRINQGVQSGALTGPEAARLQRRENHLNREIARDRADGRGFTAHERAKIQRQENRMSRHVYGQKHDLQRR